MSLKLLQIKMDAPLAKAWMELKSSPEMERNTQAGLLFVLIAYYNEKKSHAYVRPVEPKAPPVKEYADQRKARERKERVEAYEAERLALYRKTGVWPRVEMSSTALPGWKAEVIVQEDGCVHFVDTKRTEEGSFRTMSWTPPEDYPHMVEYEKALAYAAREMEKRSHDPVDPNTPKQADFVDDEGMPDFDAFQAAETKYQQAQLREGWGID